MTSGPNEFRHVNQTKPGFLELHFGNSVALLSSVFSRVSVVFSVCVSDDQNERAFVCGGVGASAGVWGAVRM